MKNIPKILVVDDEPNLLSFLHDILAGHNYDVSTAVSGNQAIAALDKEKFDLILSDVNMPDGDGYSLLDHVNQMKKDKPVFIFMSGFSKNNSLDLDALNVYCFLKKPTFFNTIGEIVAKALEG